MKQYTIQEVANLHNITKKTLLHYEKKGLFTPSIIDKTNGYRYYTVDQFSLLKTIILFRSLDTPIEEIKSYLENISSKNSIKFVEKQLKVIREKRERLKEYENALLDRMDVYEKAYSLDDRYLHHLNFKEFPQRKIAYMKCQSFPNKEEILLTYRRVTEFLNKNDIVWSRHYGDIYLNEGIYNKDLKNVGVFSLVNNEIETSDNIKVFPKGTYVYTYKLGGYPDKEFLDYFVEKIKSMNFEIDGDILAFNLLDYGDTGSVEKMLYEFQVKIK